MLKLETKNPEIIFESQKSQKLYDSLPYFVDIESIIKNSNLSYIVPGGIRFAGARYPDYMINKKDIDILTLI